MVHKIYVLDTSTIAHDHSCFEKFIDNDVVIPIAVLEELDHLKTRSDSVGSNARMAIRKIDEYCKDKDIRASPRALQARARVRRCRPPVAQSPRTRSRGPRARRSPGRRTRGSCARPRRR